MSQNTITIAKGKIINTELVFTSVSVNYTIWFKFQFDGITREVALQESHDYEESCRQLEEILDIVQIDCWEDLIGQSVYVALDKDMQIIGFIDSKRTKNFYYKSKM